MTKNRLKQIASEIASTHYTKEALLGQGGLLKALTTSVLQAALEGELTGHLGYEKHQPCQQGNARNGTTPKRLKTPQGELCMSVPRDRNSTFEPQLIKKRQTRFDGFDKHIITLYAKGLSTREIQDQLAELYGVDISPTFVSSVTDSVISEVQAWQNRPLDPLYPIVYLDCLIVKVKEEGQIVNKAVYLALAVNDQGHKELLGIWMAGQESAKFWLNVLTELKNRGLQDIFICCVDGLKGFTEAIAAVYPQTQVQLCIVHMLRNSFKYVGYKERKQVAAHLKAIYTAPSLQAGEQALEALKEQSGSHYQHIYQSWKRHWEHLATFFSYPPEIRRAIYTTNAIESLNMTLRRVIRHRRIFPNDTAVMKVIYLALDRISRRWSMPIRGWPEAMQYFLVKFPNRVKP